eukprot:143295_1
MTTTTGTNDLKVLLSKPRISLPILKICFEIYHAIRPFHHLEDEQFPSLKRSAVFLFFVALRWYFFLKRLINDKNALNTPLSTHEKCALIIAIFGHLLMIWAQSSTLKHENTIENNILTELNDSNKINDNGPYSIIRHPHHIGKWISESFVAIYQNNKISMAISILTLVFTIKRANKEDKESNQNVFYQQYKRKVPSKLIPGIY